MNYIKQLNEFYSTLDYNPISTNAIVMYNVLLHIANRTGWIDEFRVSNTVLMSKSRLSIKSLQRARNELIIFKYIEYKKGSNQKEIPRYKITKLYFDQANNPPNDQAINLASDHNNKQNKTNNIYSSYDNEQDVESSLQGNKKEVDNNLIANADNFEKIWEIYPKKSSKGKSYQYYEKWVKGNRVYLGKKTRLTNRQIYSAVYKYKQECERENREKQFILEGSTFFNQRIMDYVDMEE